MPITIRVNRSAALAQAIPEAIEMGVDEAAEVYRQAMQDRLLMGYTTGEFVTGAASESVETRGSGVVRAVGTDLLYPLFWEIGHMNIFTRRFERVEHWRIQLAISKATMQRAFSDAVLTRLRSELE